MRLDLFSFRVAAAREVALGTATFLDSYNPLWSYDAQRDAARGRMAAAVSGLAITLD